MNELLWEFIAIAYAPLGAYGALVEGSTWRVARTHEGRAALVA